MNKDIETALETFRKNGRRYAKTERYYRGEHDLAFATEKFQTTFGTLFREFALNLCPAVCDSVKDKLRVNGFNVEENGGSDAPAFDSLKLWQRNRMATRAGELHKEVLKNGDAYLIIWPNSNGETTIFPNRAANITVAYDEEIPGMARWAAKYWLMQDKRVRLNLFYPDRIEKYVSARPSESGLPEAGAFAQSAGDATIGNPYGRVPVFHFANNADIGSAGQSELDAAIPIQDGLNKAVLDMLVAMEFSAFRQRWAAGIEVEIDPVTGEEKTQFTSGAGKLWLTGRADARFGDFAASDLEQFLKVKDGFRIDLASVTGTPLHYLQPHTKGFPSGEALRKAETRFLAKVRDRQESFGDVWADAMAFALMVDGRGGGIRLKTDWEDAAPIAEREFLENLLMKKRIGVDRRKLLLEAGYGRDDATVTAITEGINNYEK
ncbi:MAG: phage portal protein [Pyrinomonadaceae bacterium]